MNNHSFSTVLLAFFIVPVVFLELLGGKLGDLASIPMCATYLIVYLVMSTLYETNMVDVSRSQAYRILTAKVRLVGIGALFALAVSVGLFFLGKTINADCELLVTATREMMIPGCAQTAWMQNSLVAASAANIASFLVAAWNVRSTRRASAV